MSPECGTITGAIEEPMMLLFSNQITYVPDGQLHSDTGDTGMTFAPCHVYLTCLCDCWFYSIYFPINLYLFVIVFLYIT